MLSILPTLGLLAYIATLITLSGISVLCSSSINAKKVPMQWDFSGAPTWFADKQIGLWFPVVIYFLVGTTIIYKARSSSTPSWSDYVALLACSMLMVGVHYWHVSKIVSWSQNQP